MPSKAEQTMRWRTQDSDEVQVHVVVNAFSRIEINAGIPDDVFEPHWPAGVAVRDHVRGVRYYASGGDDPAGRPATGPAVEF